MEGGLSLRGGETSSGVFLELKHCCLELLDLVQNPNNNSPALSRLLLRLRSSPSSSLQPLFDYTLFPLLLLLDAAVSCRSSKKPESSDKFAMLFNNQTPIKVSDAVAEGALQCLEELLSKCFISSMDQMAALLKKLAYGAMLSPAEAAEEFREGVVRCFRTLLLNLTPCMDTCCSCRHSLVRPSLSDKREFIGLTANNLERQSQQVECLIAFLQSESAAAAVGHWLSLLLNIAEAEGARGLSGSAKLRAEALRTVRVLVAKVATPDSLAFFLPGVISQLAKVLHVSKSTISGAAGSTEAIEHAVRGLAEFLMIVLQDGANISDLHVSHSRISVLSIHETKSPESFLDDLRHLHVQAPNRSHIPVDELCEKQVIEKTDTGEKQSGKIGGVVGPLSVKRSPDWIGRASANVNKLLSKTFTQMCVHPSKRVRRGLLAAVQGLLLECSSTLKGSRLMLLECLCTLVCDDSEEVSAAAQDFLGLLFSSCGKHTLEDDVAEILSRLLEKLPKMVLGSEELMALAAAQQMLAVIYYSGPQLVVDNLLRSPIKAANLFNIFVLCLSQESVFAGSLEKLVLSKPSSTGYLHSLAELRAGSMKSVVVETAPGVSVPEMSNMSALVKEVLHPKGYGNKNHELPRMPPWFVHVGSYKLYQALAGILRLLGLSLIADCRCEVPIEQLFEIPLGSLRKLVSEIRMKDYNRESWGSWCARTQSGQLLRQASTAACILNEMLFGMSDQAIDVFGGLFHHKLSWKVSQAESVRQQVSDCIGFILHEYITPEIWDLPVGISVGLSVKEAESSNKHFFHDVAMLHQVLIDGIGVFNICLGEDFTSSGFLCSSLYLLLENLICSNSEVRHAADTVLRVITSTLGCPSVGHLVLANSDYVIDSLCHQLRHLDLNPHVPNVLAAMLSFIGVAHKVLPLLEEPIRSVSMELEILGRHQHPELTIPFLKAVAEITRAAKQEALGLPAQAESYMKYVNVEVSDVKKEFERNNIITGEQVVNLEKWNNILFKLNDNKRYRRIVASVAFSCLTAVIPLLASEKKPVCLIALDIIEDGVMTLAWVEEAFRHEKETKEAIEELVSLCSFHHLQDILDAAEEGADENRLLPAMNKIWPFFVACVKNKIPVLVRRCVEVISKVVKICGGNFFTRRFHIDGSHIWNLLTSSPFKRKPIRNDEKAPLLLPYRRTSRTSEDPVSESSNLKTQEAILRMIADISRDKRSSSALEIVLKKVSGLVVGIACSGVVGLRDASVDALSGLSSIDSDLIWLLLADVFYSVNDKEVQPPSYVFPELAQILPPPLSSKDYLYVQYGGHTYGFDINFSSVETVWKKLYSESSVHNTRQSAELNIVMR